jgi:hypothetical protein
MAVSLYEILGGKALTGTIQKIQTGLPDLLPQSFKTITDRIAGNKATLIPVYGNRAIARTAQYGAPASRVQGMPMGEIGLTMLHAFEEYAHNPLLLQNLLGMNGEAAQAYSVEEVDRQSLNFANRFDNLRISCNYSVLALGHIYLDGPGNVLPSSTGNVTDLNYLVPSDQTAQLGGLIGTSWATSTTDILGHLIAIKKRHIQRTGRPLKYAFYGSSVPGYIAGNGSIQWLLRGSPALAEKLYATGEIPDGLAGLTWVPMYSAYIPSATADPTDVAQTGKTDWWGASQVTFAPEPSRAWWRQYEGSYLVPRDVGAISGDPVAAAKNLDIAYGRFAYSKVTDNPVGVKQYAGDTFIPMVNGYDLSIATTAF